MRAEVLDKVEAVTYTLSDVVYHCPEITDTNEIRISVELKRQERYAEEQIRRFQKEGNLKVDGYFVSTGVVYKVYHNNTVVKKITGDEAKKIKRLIKLNLKGRIDKAMDVVAKQKFILVDNLPGVISETIHPEEAADKVVDHRDFISKVPDLLDQVTEIAANPAAYVDLSLSNSVTALGA